MAIEFTVTREREAHEPPEARGTVRDGVRMLVSRRRTGEITHHAFGDLPAVLLPGDMVVVNTSATLPAAVRVAGARGDSVAPTDALAVHFSTPLPDGAWLIELRALRAAGAAKGAGTGARGADANGAGNRGGGSAGDAVGSMPYPGGAAGAALELPGGAQLTLLARETKRLWRARLSTAVIPYLLRNGTPIRYSYVTGDWPLEAYQTVFGVRPGSAEMPSASRPFTADVVTRLVSRGVVFAPLRLDTGVSSLEGDEDPYPEPYDVPPPTARLVNLTRASGGRVIAAGTTVVRALETAAGPDGQVSPSAGWTSHIVTRERGLRAVDGLLTGFHEPQSTHLLMLEAFAGSELLRRCYAAAVEREYLWHEFGDVHLLLP